MGQTLDGQANFQYVQHPEPMGEKPCLKPGPASLHGTNPGFKKEWGKWNLTQQKNISQQRSYSV